MDHPRNRALVLGVMAAAVLAAGAGCSSDEFGTVGGSLPTDVSQDSLEIQADDIVALPTSRTIEVERQSPEATELLYLGSREGTGWQATPLFRFDFSEVADTTAGYDPTDLLKNTRIALQMIEVDANKVYGRTVDIYELASTLEESDADRPLAELIAGLTPIATRTFDVSTPTSFVVPIAPEIVKGWVDAGNVVSLAMVSRDESPSDAWPQVQHGIVGFGSDEISLASVNFFAPLLAEQTNDPDLLLRSAKPEIEAELDDDSGSFINVRPDLDFTHFETPAALDTLLRLESHRRGGRLYLRFDPSTADIPDNATINRAELRLTVDTSLAIGRDGVDIQGETSTYEQFGSSLRAYTASPSEVEAATRPADLERVLRGDGGVDPFLTEDGEDPELVLDVTDYLQRLVNGVFGDDTTDEAVGLVLGLDAEVLEWTVIPFHSSGEKAPRLIVTFTPPADFWR